MFLAHILDSIHLVEEYSMGETEAKFHKNRPLQDAIIRRLEIIVDLLLTWKVVKQELPLIKKKLSAILSSD